MAFPKPLLPGSSRRSGLFGHASQEAGSKFQSLESHSEATHLFQAQVPTLEPDGNTRESEPNLDKFGVALILPALVDRRRSTDDQLALTKVVSAPRRPFAMTGRSLPLLAEAAGQLWDECRIVSGIKPPKPLLAMGG
jgi:hypothetical protein